MKPFEIIFILLLMLPVGLLMRYFVTRLSRETPKQGRTRLDDQKPSVQRWFRRKRENRKARTQVSVQEIPAQPDRRRFDAPRRSTGSTRSGHTETMKQADRTKRASRGRYERPASQVSQPNQFRQKTSGREYSGQYRKPGYSHQPTKHVVSGSSYPPDPGFMPRSHTALKRTQRIPFSEIYAQTDGKGLDPNTAAPGAKAGRSQQEPTKRQKRNIRKRSFRRKQNRNKNKEPK